MFLHLVFFSLLIKSTPVIRRRTFDEVFLTITEYLYHRWPQ